MFPEIRKVMYPTIVSMAALLTVAGCHKKQSPPAPPPPTVTAPAPTADITATPSSVAPGDGVILTWHTRNATDISIEGMGTVASAGTQTVHPTQSTSYHLIARGDGGTTDATANVTVTTPTAAPPSNMNEGDVGDAVFHQNVKDIFFDYDSYDINATAQPLVTQDASYLSAHPNLKIVLGGYCDDRGSTEYNLALGENRANATKQALVSAGISPDRIRTVSYGKEKQFCTEQDESCYQLNRRAQFEIDR